MHRYSIVEDGLSPDKAEYALVLLHGRGGNAEDIMILADEFCDDTFYIAAPQATDNSWYPNSFLAPEVSNEPWLTSALQTVERLVNKITEHIPSNKIYIMGFSQGACLSLEFAGRYPAAYAGITAFSGGLIGEKIKPEKYTGSFPGTKIFIGNSDKDPHIPLERARASAELLKSRDADVLLKIYPGMGHTITTEEIEDVKSFMNLHPGR
ncbi:MAG TPA: dienelactone hydrolase family protein [Bacteroidales bacterium]|nr:dienelactone hydrolase family protein [Bacteroidales bacterium]